MEFLDGTVPKIITAFFEVVRITRYLEIRKTKTYLDRSRFQNKYLYGTSLFLTGGSKYSGKGIKRTYGKTKIKTYNIILVSHIKFKSQETF